MKYKELFSSINCRKIVIIEDDFTLVPYQKERVLYDIARMSLEDRELFLDEVKAIEVGTADAIKAFLCSLDECFDGLGNWNDDVPQGDITGAFILLKGQFPEKYDSIKEYYDTISDSELQKICDLGSKYCVGVNHPASFNDLFDNYILADNRSVSVRIYTNFSAETQKLFKRDLDSVASENGIVCIIDNQLEGTNRAEEILQVVAEKSGAKRLNVVGCVFSSKEAFEQITEKLYFEYVSKETPGSMVSCIAKSAYNLFISELKDTTLAGLEQAFDAAIKNKGIAFFLSQKARIEGMSEYEIINDWIKLLSTSSSDESKTIKRMVGLSRVINSLDDDTYIDEALQLLNTLEAFDYSVNEFHLPIAAGDIFQSNSGEWFVLVGQDCDMARRPRKGPRNALAELLPAKIKEQTDFKKWANDLESASIYSFRQSLTGKNQVLQVKYQHRQYLCNEIINLCAFNSDGQCCISLSESMTPETVALMPEYMVEYYKTLQNFFTSVVKLKSQSSDVLSQVLNTSCTNHLFTIDEFGKNDDEIHFGLRRVCRLNHTYLLYLYKLYLEYRGRQPFQTINLIRQEDVTVQVLNESASTGLNMSVSMIPVPDKTNPKDYCWILDATEVNTVLQTLGWPQLAKPDQEIILGNPSHEFSLVDKKKLLIKKAKGKIIFTKC